MRRNGIFRSGTNYTTTYKYTSAKELIEVRDAVTPTPHVTLIHYDTLGRKRYMVDPDMGRWDYTYDANGNLLTQTDAKGQQIEFQYDEFNRVKKKTYLSTPDPEVTYEYDGGINGIGRLWKVTTGLISAPTVKTTYDEYDPMGRIKKMTKIIAGDQARTTNYTYDLSGKPLTVTYPDGANFKVTYAYHLGTGLLNTVKGSDNKTYATLTGYTPSGKIGKVAHANNTSTTYTYDSYLGRLQNITTENASAVVIQKKDYNYTMAGDILTIRDAVKAITYIYEYDKLHRLLNEKKGAETSLAYT